MRVIHWNMRYLPLLGGIESYVDTLIRFMPEIEFEIITDALPNTELLESYRPNATIRRFLPVEKVRMSKRRKLAVSMGAFRDSLRETREQKYLRRASCDVLHVHDFEKNLLHLEEYTGFQIFGKLAAKLHDLRDLPHPKLMTKHFMFTEENSSPVLRRWEERLVSQFKTLICVDKPIAQRFSEIKQIDDVLFIPNPIDAGRFVYSPLPSDETLHLGFIGRLDRARGEQLLLECARNLPRGTDLSLAIQHPGPRLDNILRSLKGQPVNFELDVPNDAIPGFLHKIHVLLNPIVDTYSTTRVTLEAMSAGRPAIMFNTGERYPMQHWDNGFLIEPNLKSLINLIEEIKSGRKSLNDMTKRAREAVEKEFAAPLIASKIYHLYQEISVST